MLVSLAAPQVALKRTQYFEQCALCLLPADHGQCTVGLCSNSDGWLSDGDRTVDNFSGIIFGWAPDGGPMATALRIIVVGM